MSKPKLAGEISVRKKSVSKASAAKGREDSIATKIKKDENERISRAQGIPDKLADVYRERLHDVDKQRKVHRGGKSKK